MGPVLRALLGRLGRMALAAGAAVMAFMWIRGDAARDANRTAHVRLMEKTADAQGRMLDAAGDRPRDRDTLARRLRDGRF
ncbi:hypothetical protein [Roseospira visakhapatnamensis]|uniref:Uncharacterized protein n=1 Tax=Roseospira visakhapatnamensis TaxID=390880 RepID=A0A7W6RH85_9PROT|nr:hypothetical protein [Roseospira visakhapatnamensis]MBB4267823.1 hypothetical protein [Roseospira visakhapatnamensis]